MKISAAQAYCILDTVGSSILTKSGEISVSYLLELPEAYSLDRKHSINSPFHSKNVILLL